MTDMSDMFSRAAALGGDISTWDVSGVAGMYGMFRNAAFFKRDTSKWDVSSVADMSYMLYDVNSSNHGIYKR